MALKTLTRSARTQTYKPVPVTPPPGPVKRFVSAVVPPVIMGLLLIGLYAWVRSQLPPHRLFLMPSAQGLWEQAFSKPEVLQELWERSLVTISIAVCGLAVSIPLGMAIGIVMFRFHVMERAVFPYLVALQSIPILAIIPLIQSALGFGFLPKVLIVALFTFFAVPTTLLLGLKSQDPGILNLFRLQGAGWRKMLWKAGLPSAAPALFAGFRISTSMAIIGAVTSELFFLAGKGGLGQMLINAKTEFKYEQMYAALIASSALSIGIFLIFTWVGNLLFSSWHESASRRG
ncbi:ABC transporter permease [Pseudoruegeria sp. HB172150]|uniref:ABC transporter permease n=1 Tax=Pseudoruegeria sp. HB172150 TaxID=2721164 RepID=UPI00155182AF|nr:ABC transporter permease subunit [Pseudoruegeria sp. HB172150]